MMNNPFQLIDAYLDGTLTDEQGVQLSAWIKEDAENARAFARETFVSSRMHDLTAGQFLSTQFVAGEVIDESCEVTCEANNATVVVRRQSHDDAHRIPRRRLGFWLSSALSLMLMGVLFAWANRDRWNSDDETDAEHNVAFLATVENVQWAQKTPWRVGDRLGPDVVRFDSGSVRLDYSHGVLMNVEGPADFEVIASKKTLLRAGRTTVKSPRRVVGFEVMTLTCDIVDMVGSHYGVECGPHGETNIVVFQGAVEVTYIVPDTNGRVRGTFNLGSAEAAQVEPNGTINRLSSVTMDAKSNSWFTSRPDDSTTTISHVAEVRQELSASGYYCITKRGLTEDVRAYVDRYDQWNGVDSSGLPKELLGADFVAPYQNERSVSVSEIDVTLTQPASLYVFFDDRAELPSWLTESFADSGKDIGLDQLQQQSVSDPPLSVGPGRSIDRVFSIWERVVVQAGTIRLGAMQDADDFNEEDRIFMFGVAAKPLVQLP